MKFSSVNNAWATARTHMRALVLPLAVASLMLAFTQSEVQAQERVRALEQERQPARPSGLDGVAEWMKERFSQAEIEQFSADDFRVEPHFCSCSDKPEPHVPYAVVLFTTPKGDLVARAEPQEQSAKFTPLAVRNGDQYCELESEDKCYGSFSHVCEFTDFRYGPMLEPYFPTCK